LGTWGFEFGIGFGIRISELFRISGFGFRIYEGLAVFVRLQKWLDHRTGYRRLVDALLIEHIPGGAKWRYVWGSCLAFVFAVQLITGLLLMTAYSPGDSTAWSSVYFIQYEMDFGWLIRGLHHFGSQTMVVLIGLHMLQVVIAGAHLPPREVNWWLGLGLLGAVLALSLTGYLLPWDQKGYWATQVATNIAGNLPVIGPWQQKIIVGGPVYGHHTLTRFYTLHVGILPPLVILLTIAHLTVFRRHGVTTPRNAQGGGWFWPDQAFRDLLVSLLIFGIMLSLVVWGHGHKIDAPGSGDESSLYERVAHAGRDGRGANLDAPADPSRPYPARPEWYFLFLFQLLKYFEGDQEIIGTVFIPMGVGLLLAVLPLLGYGWMRKFGHAFGVLVVVGLLGSVAVLTYLALAADRGESETARLFQDQLKTAEESAHRAIQLAQDGVPASGAVFLLRNDPWTRGKTLFLENCASCHNHGSDVKNESPTAADLDGFGTPEWIRDLVREPDSPRFFGKTKLTAMINWVKRTRPKLGAGEEKEWELAAAWLGTHPRAPVPQEDDPSPFAQGYRAFEKHCGSCHTYQGTGGGSTQGPDFTGYGDAEWLRMMIMAPNHPLRYGDRNRNTMPLFRDLEGPTAEVTRQEVNNLRDLLAKKIEDDDPQAPKLKNELAESTRLVHLSDIDRELLIRWLLKDYRAVFGGEPVTGPPLR
jgi:ubiquinol-cytochrome c reductase cytochrome b subunit